jgi:Arc/MetJ-type ribon-helix-helix transcriptional regulator
MATKKVTVTLDETQLASIRELVSLGKSSSVSAFVQHAVSVSLADVSGWSAMLGIALRETGGPLTRKERDWADSLLQRTGTSKTKPKGKGKRKAA